MQESFIKQNIKNNIATYAAQTFPVIGKIIVVYIFHENNKNNDNDNKNYDNTDNNQNVYLIGKSILVCEDSIPEDLFLSAHFSTWLPYSIGNSAKK